MYTARRFRKQSSEREWNLACPDVPKYQIVKIFVNLLNGALTDGRPQVLSLAFLRQTEAGIIKKFSTGTHGGIEGRCFSMWSGKFKLG